MALRAMLTSPPFLFRIEQGPGGTAGSIEQDPASVRRAGPALRTRHATYRIDDLDLASRLSFFLWSSIPDDQLLDAAVGGRLKDSAVLEQQVRRMLADKRADALVTNFASQWLYLRNLESAKPDSRLFPDFDDNLRQAFRRETELLFESVVKENRSVIDLLRADYTFLNERLAKHYGIPNVYGSHFRRVDLGPNHVRGGLLGQGSIMTVTSYANRTSPVRRGQWILENLLGTPVPPPPVNVPPLPENEPGAKILTDARADGSASRQRGVRELPSADGSGGAGNRKLRCDWPISHSERSRRSHRRVRRVARRQLVRRRHRPAHGRAEPARAVRDDAHGEADDLRAGPRARVLRRAGRSRYHAPRAHG